MNVSFLRSGIRFLALLLLGGLAIAPASRAQMGGAQPQQAQPSAKQDQSKPATAPAQTEAPKTDPEEDAAYKAFYEVKADNADQRIKVGEAFLQKYPTSKYTQHVYAGLTNAYYGKEQYDKMYAAADKTLALAPDNVDVLVLVGWVIPHNYDPNDLEAERRLDKAEGYLTHAIALLPSLTKPDNMTEDQFNKVRTENTAMAHSGLGLVYFRRQQVDKSTAELELAVKGSSKPDPVDYFVLGRDLQALKRYAESADAYSKCAQIQSGVQATCKQRADDVKKLAASQPAPPKP
jgi:tetratricopeptide (TPR) repeat protein